MAGTSDTSPEGRPEITIAEPAAELDESGLDPRPDPTHKRGTFASLAVPNYRKHFIGTLISASGTWMQSTGQAWLLLRVLHQGDTAVGLVVAMQFLPMLVAGAYGGLLADRFDKRRILLVTQILYAVVTGGLAAITLAGDVHVWIVFVSAALGGVVSVIDVPTRQAFASELVGAGLLTNAVG